MNYCYVIILFTSGCACCNLNQYFLRGLKYMYKAFFKRLLDIVLSFCGIIVLSPVFLIIALAIVIDDPGPIFFKQKRVGKNKKLFKILKFRSMKMSTPHDTPTHMLENPEQYITKIGKFLRKTSLDELPQIFNIFAGDRGIIGTTAKKPCVVRLFAF